MKNRGTSVVTSALYSLSGKAFSRKIAGFLIPAVLLILILTSMVNAADTSWTSHGPDGGSIMTIAIDPLTPSTLYAGALWGGIYKSTDSGVNWTELNAGQTLNGVISLAIDAVTPSTLYASITGGIIKSTDGGASWTTVNNGLTSTVVYALSINPDSPSVIYAGTSGGIFKSTDGAEHWSAASTGLTNNQVNALAINPATPTTLYAGTFGGGIFKSIDSGSNWSPVNTSLPALYISALAVDPTTPGTIYAITSSGVCKSTNAGSSWVLTNTGITSLVIISLAIDPATTSTVYACTGNGVFKSTDSGSHWGRVDAFPTNVHRLVIDPATPALVYAGTDAGIMKSLDNGVSWTLRSQGLKELIVEAVIVAPITPVAVYAGTYGGGVFKSIDNGATWSVVNTGLGTGFISRLVIDPAAPATLYAGSGIGIFKTTDGGANWSASSNGMMGHDSQALVVDPITPSVLYSGSSFGRVFKSVDGGQNWTSIKTDACDVRSLVVDPVTPTTVYVGTNGCGLFRSTDSGTTWGAVTIASDVNNVSALAIDQIVPTVMYATGDLQHEINTYTPPTSVYKSVDGGMSWIEVNLGLPYTYLLSLAIDPVATSILYIGTADGVYKSVDGAASWAPANTGLTNLVYSVAIDPVSPTTVYAGARNGVYSTTFNPMLIVNKSGNGNGSVTSSPAGIDCGAICSNTYDKSVVVTLLPLPGNSSVFDGWSGNSDCADGVINITMNTNKECSAIFNLKTFTVTALTNEGGSISPGNARTANYGSALTFTVTPDAASQIGVVSGCGGTLTGSIYATGPITGDCTVAASFVPISPPPVPFTFIDQINASLNTLVTSNAITVAGNSAGVPISVMGGEYELNSSGTWVSVNGTAINGNTVRVRLMSAPTFSTTTDAILTIGGVSDTFSVTTAGSVPSGFTDDIENGTAQWESSTGLWHVVSSLNPYPNSYSPSHSWWYGQDSTGNYYTGSSPNSSSIITTAFNVPPGAVLTFWNWEQTESAGTYYDTRIVYVSTDGGSSWTQLYQSSDNSSTWRQVSVTMSAYAGTTAKIRFEFNTVDGAVNAYRGWYIDDVQVATLVADTTPDPFSFISQTSAAVGTLITSNTVTITGINTGAPVAISGGEYEINGSGVWSGSTGTITNASTVRVRQTSSTSYGTRIESILTIGGVPGTFSVTTLAPDTTPDPFSFTDQTNVAINTSITSNSMQITGINVPATVTVSGGQYELNNSGTWSGSTGTIINGNSVRVRQTSSSSYGTRTDAILTIGGVSGAFRVTSLPPDTTPDAFTFLNEMNVPLNAVVTSNSAMVLGINAPAQITVLGGEYEINGSGAWTSAPGTVSNWNTVRVRLTSSSTYSTTANAFLTIGGVSDALSATTVASSAIVAGLFSVTNPMTSARQYQTATLLLNGKVLIAGGYRGNGYQNLADLYDPAIGTFVSTGNMTIDRYNHSATLLQNGKVLIAGGEGAATWNTAEMYDPATGTFTATTGNMISARTRHTATPLPDGRVLIVGGNNNTAEIYDPASGTFRLTVGSMTSSRVGHVAILLPNGTVLIAGGYGSSYLSSAEVYDPVTGTFTATSGNMSSARYGHTATLLPNGKVLIAGGFNGFSYLNNADIYDPITGIFTVTTGNMTSARSGQPAILLPCGKVLFAGGYSGSTFLSTAEVYDPATGSFAVTTNMDAGRAAHTATLLPNSKVLIAGGYNYNGVLKTAEVFDYSYGSLTPDPFVFADQTNAAINTLTVSNSITVEGMNAPAAVTISVGEYEVNGNGVWTSATGTVINGCIVRVRQTSSSQYVATTEAVLAIGGVSGTFRVTTLAYNPPPTVVIASPLPGLTNRNRPRLTYTASAGSVIVTVDSVVKSTVSGDTLDVLADGVHTVCVTVTDVSGRTESSSVLFTVDTIAPAVSIFSPAAKLTNNMTPLLSYTASDGTVVVKVDGVVVNKESGNMLDPLTNGSHTVRVGSTDAAGNVAFTEVAFTVDTVSPTITISPVDSPTEDSWQVIRGTREQGALVTVAVDSSAVAGAISYKTAMTWNCTISKLVKGTNTITAIARDAAGNTASASRSIRVK